MDKEQVHVSEVFRVPLGFERDLGLWVDRIGTQVTDQRPKALRVLGLHAAVAVESGSGGYYSEATGEVAVGTGDVIAVFPDVPHAYWPAGVWRTSFVVWSGPEAEKLERLGFASRGSPVVRGGAALVVDAHRKLAGLMRQESPASVLERKLALLELLAGLCGRTAGGGDAAVERALASMYANFTSALSVADYAAKARLSVTHFRRRFKACAAATPKEFLISLRMAKAKELLSQGTSIKETAALAGFEDISYFMRLFKRVVGQPPGQFAGR